MGKIDVGSLGGFSSHTNTQNEYDNEVSETLLNHRLSQIVSIYNKRKGCVCYVLGMGAQPKSTYAELRKESGIEVVWTDSILSGLSKVLSIFMASHAGLIKISDSEKLPNIVNKLCHMSMAGVYIFSQSMEKGFVNRVIENPLPKDFDFGIKDDDGYFFYIVDADSAESSTGIYEIISYGNHASDFASAL